MLKLKVHDVHNTIEIQVGDKARFYKYFLSETGNGKDHFTHQSQPWELLIDNRISSQFVSAEK
jgi:hypothetical protein